MAQNHKLEVTEFDGTKVECINPRISGGFTDITILLFWGNPTNLRGAAPGMGPTVITDQ